MQELVQFLQFVQRCEANRARTGAQRGWMAPGSGVASPRILGGKCLILGE